MSTDTVPSDPDVLRAQLVDQIRGDGYIRTAAVEAALKTVPRHLFLPDVGVEEAYADRNVATKRDTDGAILSSASMPTIVAMMLEQLAIEPGYRVLEIGAGTGYNAALLRELVGPAGVVATVDVDPDVVDGARRNLATAGCDDVHVICGDGEHGHHALAPYDRIIITAGAWDLPEAWWDQLTPGGRIVVPLRWRGQTRSVAFDRQPGHLISRSVQLCGFIPMRGNDGEHTADLDDGGDVTLCYDDDQPIAPDALRGVLDHPKTESWSGVTIGGFDPFDGVWLHLTAAEPGTCRITAQPAAVDAGLARPAIPSRSPAIAEQTSLAYLTHRILTAAGDSGEKRWELGAIGHGPTGSELAERISQHVRAWNSDRGAQPTITAHPTSTPPGQLPERFAIHKKHTRLTFARR